MGNTTDFSLIPESTERLASVVVDGALKVHRALGPGLLESVYEACLARELDLRQVPFKTQVAVPVVYEGVSLEVGFRADFVVGEQLVVEIKAVEGLLPVHRFQVLTYLKRLNMRLGLLINFNVPLLKRWHQACHPVRDFPMSASRFLPLCL